jgi:hypothetical protein
MHHLRHSQGRGGYDLTRFGMTCVRQALPLVRQGPKYYARKDGTLGKVGVPSDEDGFSSSEEAYDAYDEEYEEKREGLLLEEYDRQEWMHGD